MKRIREQKRDTHDVIELHSSFPRMYLVLCGVRGEREKEKIKKEKGGRGSWERMRGCFFDVDVDVNVDILN